MILIDDLTLWIASSVKSTTGIVNIFISLSYITLPKKTNKTPPPINVKYSGYG